jgi:hypothetical protein
MKHFIVTTLITALLLPTAAFAVTQNSTNYSINAGRIVSGGTAATDDSGLTKSGISVGQGIYIPPAGTTSPSYTTKAAELPTIATGGEGILHSGDINGDGRVDIVDALLALKAGVHLIQLSSTELFRGDVGPLVKGVAVGNGRIDVEDAMLILRKAVRLGW